MSLTTKNAAARRSHGWRGRAGGIIVSLTTKNAAAPRTAPHTGNATRRITMSLTTKNAAALGAALIAGLGAALIAGLGAAPAGAQEAVTADDYEAAMQELRYLATDTSLHIDASYWGDVGEDSDKIRDELAKVEAFWTAQEQARAVEFAAQATEAARSIGRASGAQDRNAATAALAELRNVCEACHAEFREETDDGFRIRPDALR